MSINNPSKLVALIAGPTASGKSAVAMQLAEATDGVIINADSAQVYADLRVLSARPSIADEARVPHRLFGFMDGAEACSAGRWAEAAREAITAVQAEGRLPILVGGTGLYIRTLLDGIAPVPDIPTEIREAVRALPVAEAHAALSQEDPAAAARLAPADSTRVARALEVIRGTGRTMADWQGESTGGIAGEITLAPLVLLPPRGVLYARCDARLDEMVAHGAADEVSALLARKLDPDLPVMNAIGVRELASWITGARTREGALGDAKQATRRYAKRQVTWFSNQSPADWPVSTQADNYDWIAQVVTKLR